MTSPLKKPSQRASKLPKKIFAEVVKNTPLVSIDIIARDKTGRILLGIRKNEPAKGFWFVPGGIIRKNEAIRDAFGRITFDELGESVAIEKARFLGVFEHFWESNFTGQSDFGTHYVVLAYAVAFDGNTALIPDDQHEEMKWFSVADIDVDDVHPYTKNYFYLDL